MATRRRLERLRTAFVRLDPPATFLWISAGTLAALIGFPCRTSGLTVDQLGPDREIRVDDVEISGNETFPSGRLKAMLTTRERAWYAPWRRRPVFDVYVFQEDLQRLKRFYESEGFYEAEIGHDLALEDDRATVKIQIDENERVKVGHVAVSLKEAPGEPQAVPTELPLRPGDPFREETYHDAENTLKEFFLKRSYAFTEIERDATVDLARDEARIRYVIERGPATTFGETKVEGTESVDPEIIYRELEFRPGQPFSLAKIRASRANLLRLRLFGTVRIGWEAEAKNPAVAGMTVHVEEKPPREIRFGIGYGTEDEFRAQFRWQHNNWLGGARQLSFTTQYSTVTSSVAATFIQPHFPGHDTRTVLPFRQDQEREETFDLLASRFDPHFEHRFTETTSGRLGWGVTYASLSDIDDETASALGGVKRSGFLSGPSLGWTWNTTEDPLQPTSGHVVTLSADQRGTPWGGSYRFYKLGGEGKQYWSVGWDAVVATRLGIGLGDTLGSAEDFPIFERHYAGGQTSVRGYGRRRLGPKSSSDRPLGGLSLVEGSTELRRRIWGALGGVAFVDYGQVSLDAFDPPFGDLDFSAGPGITYQTPVGPLALFIGFPFDPPPGDATWQIHFSIGQFF